MSRGAGGRTAQAPFRHCLSVQVLRRRGAGEEQNRRGPSYRRSPGSTVLDMGGRRKTRLQRCVLPYPARAGRGSRRPVRSSIQKGRVCEYSGHRTGLLRAFRGHLLVSVVRRASCRGWGVGRGEIGCGGRCRWRHLLAVKPSVWGQPKTGADYSILCPSRCLARTERPKCFRSSTEGLTALAAH